MLTLKILNILQFARNAFFVNIHFFTNYYAATTLSESETDAKSGTIHDYHAKYADRNSDIS